MSSFSRLAARALRIGLTGLAAACSGAPLNADWLYDDQFQGHSGRTGFSVQWRKRITAEYDGPFVAVERAVPTLDPAHDRVFVGTSEGNFYALTASGRRVYRYDAGGAIASAAALDLESDEVFVATEQGSVHKLTASNGRGRWRSEVGGPIQSALLLDEDHLVVATDDDQVIAIARDNGDVLWRHVQPPVEGFGISGHAGPARVLDRIVTGFSDGIVAAFDRADGTLAWAQDLSLEVASGAGGRPQFVDVDTTPLVLGERVMVASFAGGFHVLDGRDGSVTYRDAELTGITGLSVAGRCLLVASADHGVLCLDKDDYRERWRKELTRGAPTAVAAGHDLVLLGESSGSFLALGLRDGQERSRIDSGHGFSAAAAVTGGRAFVLSNGGTLIALTL